MTRAATRSGQPRSSFHGRRPAPGHPQAGHRDTGGHRARQDADPDTPWRGAPAASASPPPTSGCATATDHHRRDGHVVHADQRQTSASPSRVRRPARPPATSTACSTSLPVSPTSGDAIANMTPPTITGQPTSRRQPPHRQPGHVADVLRDPHLHLRLVARRCSHSRAPRPPPTRRWLLTWAQTSSSGSPRLRNGFTDGVAHSNPVRVETLTASPARPGVRTLRNGRRRAVWWRHAPAWNQPDVTTTYQWLRNGRRSPAPRP